MRVGPLLQEINEIETWSLSLLEYVFDQKDSHALHKIQFGNVTLSLYLPNNNQITQDITNSLFIGGDQSSTYELFLWACSDLSMELSNAQMMKTRIPYGQRALSDRTLICLDQHMDCFYVIDRRTHRILVWIPSYEKFPYWARATPFRIPFSWIAAESDGEMVHAAAIELDGRGVLLVGNSGRGKTTTAINAALEGAKILGEDFILYTKGNVFAVYTKAKIHPGKHLDHMVSKGLLVPPAIANEKSIVDLQIQSFSMIKAFEPRIIYFPGFLADSSPTKIEKISKATALREFAGPSFIGLQSVSARSMSCHARLIRTLDSWSLPMTGQLDSDLALMRRHLLSEFSL